VLGGALATYSIYATSDGHIALAALEPHFQARLASALDADLTVERLTQVFLGRSTSEWIAWAKANDLPLAAVRQN
jgi:crotonobetainyl-CoA:carnitine CoA-transferase CaiB-like acyl-CoA transferase